MADRVIIGKRGADAGMWVSAPGKSASSTVFEDLLVDTTRLNTQPILMGSLVNPVLNFVSGSLSGPSYQTFYNYNTAKFELFLVFSPGTATYELKINHNLGYVPLTQITIGSPNAGNAYPSAYVTTTQIIFRYIEYWDCSNQWSGFGYNSIAESSKPATYTAPCTINYTVYRQRAI